MGEKRDVNINREWCKGCGICVAFCPKKVLILDEEDKAFRAHTERCKYCGLCELLCPDIAIEFDEGKDQCNSL
jgi:2-oxoglutarate ferredoxin oxidoreductase subunit delta